MARLSLGDLDKLRVHLGPHVKVLPMADGLSFYASDLSLTIHEDSPLFTSMATLLKRAQNMGSLLNISATSTLTLPTVPHPSALLVRYHITAGYE